VALHQYQSAAGQLAFQNSLLIVVFDEAEDTDTENGGGHVPAVIVSPLAKAGYQSTTLYQHESTLRLMMEGLGVTDFYQARQPLRRR